MELNKEKSSLYEFSVEPDEQKELVLKVKHDKRALVRGVVVDECGKVIKEAAVKLFQIEKKDKCVELLPLTHAFTDEFGQFIFGPLCPNKRYAIKVWVNNVCVSRDCAELEECGECIHPEICKKGCGGKDDYPRTPGNC